MIERKYDQRQLGEGFIRDSIDDCWEPWMRKADEILEDEELIDVVYEALRRRRPQSGTRGRKGTPAEVAMRNKRSDGSDRHKRGGLDRKVESVSSNGGTD